MIREAALRFRCRTFCIHGEGNVSFVQAAHRACQVQRAWSRDAGLQAEEPIGLAAEPTSAGLWALLAALEHPGPVFLLHPRSPPRERMLLANQYSFRWMDIPADGRKAAASDLEQASDVQWLADSPFRTAKPKWIIFFTSGSTGRPKAVRHGPKSLHAAALSSAANLGWQRSDRWLLSIPPSHVGGFSIVSRCLWAGQPVVLPEATAKGFEPDAFWEDVARFRVRLASWVPTMLGRVLRTDPSRSERLLRAVLVGGAKTPDGFLTEARRRRLPVLTTYGLTEAASQVTTQPYGTRPDPEWGSGRPLPGVKVRIGADGRVGLRGKAMFQGYEGEPCRNEQAWFEPGDLGRWEQGCLHLTGRAQSLIVTGGENVDPAEVEAALLEHPAVDQAAVWGADDPEWGERVEAAVSPKVPADLNDHLRRRLAGFKCPKRIVGLPQLPLTPIGKPDRKALAEATRKRSP